jgi:hypothetical protein
MTDLKQLNPWSQKSASPYWAHLRDRAREIIRAEVEKLSPTEDARRPLELIVESSVRYAEAEDGVAITVVDSAGHPRTKIVDDRVVPFTIHDFLEELRRTRPMLFKPAPHPERTPVQQPPEHAVILATKPDVQASPGIRKRDWLNVGTDGTRTPRADRPRLLRVRRGRVRLHLRSRIAPEERARSSPEIYKATPRVYESDSRQTFDPTLGIFGGVQDTASPGRRGLAVGAVAIMVLLAIGGLAFLGGGGAFDEGESDPGTTGAVSTSKASPALPSAAFRARTLRGVPDVLDTATLSLEGEVVRLFGVEWAPGGGKPEDLTQYLRGREVVCKPTGTSETYRCQVGGQDLSRVVLFNGGGKATAEATEDLKAAEEKARSARIGVWSQ